MNACQTPRPRPIRITRVGALLLVLVPLAVAVAGPLKTAVSRPESPHGKFHGQCADCHSANAWTPAKIGPKFDHAKFGFPLEGAHAATDCKSCHASLDFTQEKQLCASCHQDVHRGEFGTECARCHTSRSFVDRATMLRMHQTSKFPLTGSHAGLDCEGCHTPAASGQMQFVGKRAECSACHMADYQAAKTPDHAAGHFPMACNTCHTTTRWAGAPFNHDLSAFPLTGAHRSVACASCHGDNVFNGKSTACVSCHQADYNATTNPSHAAAGYSTQCQTCHTTAAWAGAGFDHNTTAFPLTGAHQTSACNSCHGDGIFAGKSTACLSCHQSDFNGTTNPPHAAAGFSTQCQTCHTTTAWPGATFDHNQTAFPLVGAHPALPCASCHGNGVYAGKPTTCISCHQANYQAAPNHVAGNYSQTCLQCHTQTTWLGAMFAHSPSMTNCVSCHHADFVAATSPVNHVSQGIIESACSQCHTNSSSTWQPTTYVHGNCYNSSTHRAHQNARCSQCHQSSYPAATCTACHQNRSSCN